MPQFIEQTHFNKYTKTSFKTFDPVQVRTFLFVAADLLLYLYATAPWYLEAKMLFKK